jgi:hypothetical protein
MVHMRITFYPNLKDALETLKENEYLYTHSWLPVRIKYKHRKRSNDYEPVSIKGFRNVLSRYNHILFRKEVIENLIKGLISAVENNSEVFKEPLKEAITIGLKELNIDDKKFVCVGNVEYYYPKDHVNNTDELNEPILMSMRKEKWKENFLSLGNLREKFEEELSERIMKMKGIKPGYNYQGWGQYRWISVLSVADKKIIYEKGRALAKFWEKEGVLGIESLLSELGSVLELKPLLQEKAEKLGQPYAKENLSKILLGTISLYLPNLPKPEEIEAALVPFNVEDKNEKGDKEVEFLVLLKLKIGDVASFWRPVSINYDSLGLVNSSGAIKEGTKRQIKLVDREKMPVELSKEEKANFIITDLTEEVEIRKQDNEGSVKDIIYETKAKNFKIVRVGIEEAGVSVKEYKEIEKTKTSGEKIIVKLLLPKGETECLENSEESIRKDIGGLANELKTIEVKEKDQEKRNGLKMARIVSERLIEMLEKRENIEKRECRVIDKSTDKNIVSYKLYSSKEFEIGESLIEAAKGFPTSGVEKRAKKMIELMKSERDKKLCFKIDGLEKKIDVVNVTEEMLKEPHIFYIKTISGTISEMLKRRISEIKGILGELEDINNLSIALSGVVASAIGRLPHDTNKINEMTKEVYKILLRSMVGGELWYYDGGYGYSEGWKREEGETLFRWKMLIRDMVGIRIKVMVTETTEVELSGEEGGAVEVKRKVTTSTTANYGEDLWAVYLDSGYKGKLVEMTVVR